MGKSVRKSDVFMGKSEENHGKAIQKTMIMGDSFMGDSWDDDRRKPGWIFMVSFMGISSTKMGISGFEKDIPSGKSFWLVVWNIFYFSIYHE